MMYHSIDAIQQNLANDFFARTSDAKKASGRALGTLVEIIVYYLLKTCGFQRNISIETQLPEYGMPTLTHNVEFTLHKSAVMSETKCDIERKVTTRQIINELEVAKYEDFKKSSLHKILDIAGEKKIIKNCALLGETSEYMYIANIDSLKKKICCNKLNKQAFAMIECKRVGREGSSKGPQTIEKAKQGAYVAKTISSLQKVKNCSGELMGLYFKEDGSCIVENYYDILQKIVNNKYSDIKGFILSIGVISNHGNWFSSEHKSKELEVLCNSYDWLLFLSDEGLVSFVNFISKSKYCKNAFSYSYSLNEKTNKKNRNCFTKSYIDIDADKELTKYFKNNIDKIITWFSVLTPAQSSLQELFECLNKLKGLEI